MKRGIISVLTIFFMALTLSNVQAHYHWINVDNYNPMVDEEITISIGYGHQFPAGEVLKKVEKIEKFYLVDPEGKIVHLEVKTQGEGEDKQVSPIKMKSKTKGTYLIVLEKKPGFVSKTTEGYKSQSKKGLQNVLSSSWSEGSAKTFINVGETAGESFLKDIGQRCQIIPLDNPTDLKEGDYLRLKTTLDGKPYSTFVYGTYAEFSEDKDTFAYTTKTNKEGIAKIKILKKGVWLIKTSDTIPYPNPDEADSYSFTNTLTFKIK
ncbi:MAG: DUF4198 domain-containing protein [bacterium]